MLIARRPVGVLIADDDFVAREVLSSCLRSFGCRVQIACDGYEALCACRDRLDRIELVILDASMPGPSPLRLCQSIRQMNSNVPILFCSGMSADDPAIRTINQSGLQLLRKPFRRSNLYEAILGVLRQAGSSALAH